MKIVAIVDNDSFNKKYLVELTSDELVKLTQQENSVLSKNDTKDIVGKEFEINSILNASKVIQSLTFGPEYDSVLTKQRAVVSALEKLQKPMLNLKEQLKQVKPTK